MGSGLRGGLGFGDFGVERFRFRGSLGCLSHLDCLGRSLAQLLNCLASPTCILLTNKQTYMHTYIHTHKHTYIHAYIHTHKHTYIHTYIHTNIHKYIHTNIHTYIHMLYNLMYRYMPPFFVPPSLNFVRSGSCSDAENVGSGQHAKIPEA